MSSMSHPVHLDELDLRFIDAAVKVLHDADGDDRQEPVVK